VPEIVGGLEFDGAVDAALMRVVALDAAVAEPSAFVALTRTRKRIPASVAVTLYC
jgi:hypothetical protein